MPDIIHLLPDSVANQIAAGEVIQRPASVLKELVENAIDAGATAITVRIKDAGRTLIHVMDNGKGMSETDVRMAFERHATSKIRHADDLYNLHTMGFRGEALPSIVSVAQVEVRTRRPEDELGTHLVIAGSQVITQEPVACAPGSQFEVKNLFFNVPARRRFLKSNTTELKNLLTEFYRIVLVNPQVAFLLSVDDEEMLDLPSVSTKARIDAVFSHGKKNFSQQLLPIEADTQLVKIKGYIGKPEAAQKTAQQYFFVNGRYMRHPYFHKAVMNAYTNMLRPDHNPNYFIYFDISPESIDVNIHPTKTEIKFADEQAIWPILSATVKEALGKFNVVPAIDFDRTDAVDIPVLTSKTAVDIRQPQTGFNPDYNPFGKQERRHSGIKDWEQLYSNFESQLQENIKPVSGNMPIVSVIEDAQQQVTFKEDTDRTEVMQLHGRYLVIPVRSGLMLIDQHRAHSRVLYERYMSQMEKQKGLSQKILFPEVIEINQDDVLLLEELMPDLQAIGFDIERFGKQAFSINGVPANLTDRSPQETVADLLATASNIPVDLQQVRREKLAASLASLAAIRAGQILAEQERQDLVEQLFACQNHAFTPDGKAIMIIIDNQEIDKRF